MRGERRIFRSDESGGVAVIMAIMLTAVLSMAGLVLDLGHLFTVRTEVRKAAEAGAFAGARALTLPKGNTDWNWDNGRATAVNTVQQNTADNRPLADFPISDVQVGYWDLRWDAKIPHDLLSSTITPAIGQVAAVKVTIANRQGGSGSSAPIATWFAAIMGIHSMEVQGSAVAMVSPPTTIRYSEAFPFALPFAFVDQHLGDDPPTPFRIACDQHSDSGGQWTSLKTEENGANYIDGLIMGTNTTDSLSVGDQVYIQNGERASIYNVAQSQEGKIRYVPVVQGSLVNGAFNTVEAYVPFKITEVSGSGKDPYVQGHFVPGWIDTKANGAGGKYIGVYLPPKLVQ